VIIVTDKVYPKMYKGKMDFKFVISALVLCLILLATPAVIFASNFNSNELVILPSQETINSDYFGAGETVVLQGVVNGDVYVAGGNVTIDGTVNGDLIAAGGNIIVNGPVTGDIRVAGGNISMNGSLEKNLTAIGGTINLSRDSSIRGSVVIAGGQMTLLGPVGKGATLAGGQVALANSIGGDITAGVGKLTLNPGANIKGSLNYWSEDEASILPEASISGQITRHSPPVKSEDRELARERGTAALAGISVVFKLLSFLSALLLGFILLHFLPIYTRRTTETITQKLWPSLGTGFLTLVISPFIILTLLITLIGIPLAIVYLFILIFDLWLAKIFVSLVIGFFILNYFTKKINPYLALTVGLIVYYLISLIPFIGGLVGFITGLIGLGAIILTKRNYYLEMRQKKVV
jgi:cytoskeletal protein CcmA (bactofilin family)